MNAFSEIFGTDLTVEILGVSSILLLLLYGAGVSLLQRWKTTAEWIPAIQQHVISGLGAALDSRLLAPRGELLGYRLLPRSFKTASAAS